MEMLMASGRIRARMTPLVGRLSCFDVALTFDIIVDISWPSVFGFEETTDSFKSDRCSLDTATLASVILDMFGLESVSVS